MKKVIFVSIAVALSTAGFSQKADPVKTLTQQKATTLAKKDSANIQTPLLSFGDYVELQNFLKDKFTVKEYEIVITWLNSRYNQRIAEYNGRLK